MKRLLLAVALAAFAASVAGPAAARDDDRRGRGYHKVENDYWKDRRKAEKRAWKEHEKAEKAYRKAYRKAVKEDQKAYRRWARGQYIPVEYRQPRYYVSDYGSYRLAPPPPGHTYVRPYEYDDTYYLIELASGLVTQILGD
jgi:Ni/Co efflux regulator RcnB